MLKFGNKEFRNLQEQVKKNMDDILFILQEEGVLNEFGIKVVGQEATSANMPTVEDYKEDNPDWSYGDAYAIGTEDPYTLYILTRANGTHPNDYWFNIGQFPVAGPQGPQGPQGDVGPQGATGPSGANGLSAGFGTIGGTAETISYGSDATVQITTSGPDTAKNIQFTFGIPEGKPGEDGASEWGEITGSLENQTDLFTALQSKQNTLVSGTNIKTINSESILGSGNIAVQPTLVSGTNIKTINNQSILGSGNINIQGGSGNVNDVEVNGVSVVDQDGVAEITVPTKTSDLTNDSGFITGITSSDVTTALGYTPGTSNFSGAYADLTGKPNIPSKTSDLTNDSGFITSSALSGYATESYVQGYHDPTKQNVISDLATIRSGAALGATSVQQGDLAEVAISGDYYDLANLPTIPTQTSDLINNSGFITSSALSGYTQADQDETITGNWTISGSLFVEDLDLTSLSTDEINLGNTYIAGSTGASKTLTLPSTSGTIALTSDIPSTANFVTTNTEQTITGIKTFSNELAVDETGGNGAFTIIGDLSNSTPATIHFSDSDYSVDLSIDTLTDDRLVKLPDKNGTIALMSDIPTVPTTVSSFTNDAGYITSSALSGYATESWVGQQGYLTSVSWSDVSGKPTFATVATSGSYNDLSNKPTIPVVDYPVTDVQVDGVSVVTNKVASIELPQISLSNVEYQSPDYELKGIEINGDTWNIPLSNYVPTSRTINNKPLSANVTLTASDVGAIASVTPTTETWTFTLSDGTTTTKTIVTAVTSA